MTTMERRPDSRGKVRDIYDAGENLLMVATDRISAFDFILPDEIPFKGALFYRNSNFSTDHGKDLSLCCIIFFFFVLDICKFGMS